MISFARGILLAILLTHFHPDHAGSALPLARIWHCPVYLHPDELPIANGDLAAITKYAASSLRDVSRPLEPGAGILALPGWRCIPTPGHTPGHVAFFRPSDRVLITGDALVTLELNSLTGLLRQRHGLSGPPRYTTWSWRAAKESVATLARLEPTVLACGHGSHLAGPGTADAVRAFAERSGDASPVR